MRRSAMVRPIHDDTRARRLRTVSRLFVLTAVVLALLPALAVVAVVVDVLRFVITRRPFMSVRLLAFVVVYLLTEVVGVVALAVAWRADLARTFAIQAAFTRSLYRAVTVIFSLRFDVDGAGCVLPGPIIVLVRHASIIDTLVPSVFITRAFDVKLRFVLKSELLEDPCLDIAGQRLPNHFVSRRADDTAVDLAAIERLATGMDTLDGALIYPEGTRHTERKHKKAVDDVAARDPELGALARQLTRVMPPKPAGVSALLDGCPAADVVVVAHTGLEGFARVDDIWSGGLVGRTVRVKMWRVARALVPVDKGARTRWLYAEWLKVNALVEQEQAA